MSLPPDSRATIRLAVGLWMVAAASGFWELIAAQSPGTPLYVGMLSEPFQALRELASVLGVSLFAAAWLMPWGFPEGEPRWFVGANYAGSLACVGAQLYAALHGMHAVQASDLRPDALYVFVLKYGGLTLVLVPLFELGRRVLVRSPPRPPST